MKSKNPLTRLGLCAVVLLGSVAAYTVGGGWFGDTVWTKETTRKMTFDPDGASAMEVRTYNGFVAFAGDKEAKPSVTATIKGGGKDEENAVAALEAIEVFVERDGEIIKIGWRWSEDQKSNWKSQVAFDVVALPGVNLDVETHNGRVTVSGVEGDVKTVTYNGEMRVTDVSGQVESETHNGIIVIKSAGGDVRAVTHNGGIEVESGGSQLHCETHNGGIDASFGGETINMITHNGSMTADLTMSGTIGGSMSTANGTIDIRLGTGTSTYLNCKSGSGRIVTDVLMADQEKSKQTLTGSVGAGGSTLSLSTANGAVKIRAGS